jgi:CRP-like cAMP-binding protein
MEKFNSRVDVSKYYFNCKPVLDLLLKEDLLLFKEHLSLKKIKKGTELFQEGDRPKGVYIIKTGKVKLYQQSPNGGEQIVYIYTPGEMFGYRPLLCNEKHPASCMTLEECSIYFLPVRYFLDALKKSTALSNVLLQNLSHEFTVLVNHIAAFAQKSAKERIALSLLILREKYRKPNGGSYTEISLSRANLASFAGTTNETLARIITKFRQEKIVKTNGRNIVINKLEALYGLMES